MNVGGLNIGALLKASGWIVAFSVLTFAASAIIAPIVVLRMPEDYFIEEEKAGWHLPDSILGWMFWIFRNVLGVCLVLAGTVMMVGPGPGILTISAGLMAMTVPGKRKLMLWLVHMGGIQRSLDWMRKKGGKPPLHFSHHKPRLEAPPKAEHEPPATPPPVIKPEEGTADKRG